MPVTLPARPGVKEVKRAEGVKGVILWCRVVRFFNSSTSGRSAEFSVWRTAATAARAHVGTRDPRKVFVRFRR